MLQTSYQIKYQYVVNTLRLLNTDAILFVSDTNRFWITNIKTSAGLCLITKKFTYFIVDNRYYNYCKLQKLPQGIKLVASNELSNLKRLSLLIKELKIKSLILESDYLTLKQYQQIVDELRIKNINSIDTDFLRIIKTDEEIKLLKKSADIIVNVMNQTRKWLKPGVTEIQTAKYIEKLILNSPASGVSFSPIVCFGKNSANPHHTPGKSILKNNQLVLIDIGCIYQGYCSDITRTFFIGNKTPNKDLLAMYQLVYAANQLGIRSIHAGITGNQIDKICRDYIAKDKKWGKLFTHALGHGVGINIHELPNCAPNYEQTIPANAVITIEPGVYDINLAGVRIEDIVVVTNKGCINLTAKAPKDFI